MVKPFTWDTAVVTNTKGWPDHKPFHINKTKIVTITYTYKQYNKRECLPSRYKFQRLRIVSEIGTSFLRLSKLFANKLRSELHERENSIPMFYKSGFRRVSACNNNAWSKIYERRISLRDLGTNKDTQCTLGYEIHQAVSVSVSMASAVGSAATSSWNKNSVWYSLRNWAERASSRNKEYTRLMSSLLTSVP